MSIETVHSEEIDGVTLSLVEISDPNNKAQKDRVWELQCERCDSLDTGLTYLQARDEFDLHEDPSYCAKRQAEQA